MPAAAPGTVITFVANAAGQGFTITQKYNPATGGFDINPALTVVSTFSAVQPISVTDGNGVVHPVSVPTGTTNVTPAQLAAFGITLHSQLTGLTLVV